MDQTRNVSVLKKMSKLVSCTFCACSDPYILSIVVFYVTTFFFFNSRRISQSLYIFIYILYYLDHMFELLTISTFYVCLDTPHCNDISIFVLFFFLNVIHRMTWIEINSRPI